MNRESGFAQLKRKRFFVALMGFFIGFCTGLPVTYFIYGWPLNVTTITSGLAGAAAALLYAEKKMGLATREQVDKARFEEELRPLSLSRDMEDHGAC
ncbi:MAG: hypothetical protein AB1631_21885 [Acidobacteriota bacterium]